MIWFGGMFCVPIAVRRRLKIITIRVKAVVSIKIAGAMESTVSIASS
jgi:hypothetical protein